MSTKTGIEWTDATWNPIRGCSRVSEGCRNCYAEKVAYRFSGPGQPYEGLVQLAIGGRCALCGFDQDEHYDGSQCPTGSDTYSSTQLFTPRRLPKWNGQIKFVEEHLLDPLKWRKPQRIFVNSMSDLFHENVTDEMLDRIFAVMALCPQHTFQVLTKRPQRMLKYSTVAFGRIADLVMRMRKERNDHGCVGPLPHIAPGATWWPLANVWLGVSVENQKAADERIPLLLQTPAAVRFISEEPLLGSVNAYEWMQAGVNIARRLGPNPSDGIQCKRRRLDWVICGGESGPGARPMHPDWARGLRDQCVAAGVPFFFKQWGEWAIDHPAPYEDEWSDGHALVTSYSGDIRGSESLSDETTVSMWEAGKKAAGRLLDGREWNEFPEAARG